MASDAEMLGNGKAYFIGSSKSLVQVISTKFGVQVGSLHYTL